MARAESSSKFVLGKKIDMSGRMARVLEQGMMGGVVGWVRGVAVNTTMELKHAMAYGKAAPAT